MQLHHRMFKGLTRPFMEVDKTLLEQGFQRINDEKLEYQMAISDPVTRSSYYLRIPCVPLNDINNELVRLGSPYLKKRYAFHPLDSFQEIPRSIRRAAEEKATEVYTYLNSI